AGDEEIDLTVGYGFSVGGGEADISIAQYAYPTVDGFDYLSAIALYSYPVGEWTLRARFEYAPPQKNLWDESVYAALETERPLGASGLTMIAKGGWEKGAFTLDGEKWDYAVGFNYQLGPSTLGLLYAGTDEDARAGEGDVYGGGFVFSASASF
ncbi:MAG: TorF family putative porin, partial [Hyphomonadaceae bacterium]